MFVKKLPRHTTNFEDIEQIVRSSGSIGANYIEANESLGKKDFVMRVKISRKEAKETTFRLNLLDVGDSSELEETRMFLLKESKELILILSSIFNKSESKIQ